MGGAGKMSMESSTGEGSSGDEAMRLGGACPLVEYLQVSISAYGLIIFVCLVDIGQGV